MSKEVKVLFVTNCYPTEIHPEFGVFTKEQIEGVLSMNGVEGETLFINGRDKGLLEYFRSIRKLRRMSRQKDVIHAFHGLTFLLTIFSVRRKPIVVSFLNNIEYEFDYDRRLAKVFRQLTYRMIGKQRVTKIFKDKIPEKFKERSYHLPNGVDFDTFYPIDRASAVAALEINPDNRYMLFVSSKDLYRKQKRYDRFVKVFEILKQKYDNLEVLTLVEEPRERVLQYFNVSELHLLTSDFEGSPNSVKEAMACNIPVVATDTGNVSEMMEGVEGCYVAQTFEVDELVSLCEKVLNNPKRRTIRESIINKGLDVKTKNRELLSIYKNSLLHYSK